MFQKVNKKYRKYTGTFFFFFRALFEVEQVLCYRMQIRLIIEFKFDRYITMI